MSGWEATLWLFAGPAVIRTRAVASAASWWPMVMVRPSLAVVHCAASGQVAQAGPNLACRRAVHRHWCGRGWAVTPGRAGHGPSGQVNGEAVLGEVAFHRRGRLNFESIVDLGVVQSFQ
jgi:hypothetical protein